MYIHMCILTCLCVLDCNVRHIFYSGLWSKSWRATAPVNIGEKGLKSTLPGLPSEADISLSIPVSLWVSLMIIPENHWSDILTVMLWHSAIPHCHSPHPTMSCSSPSTLKTQCLVYKGSSANVCWMNEWMNSRQQGCRYKDLRYLGAQHNCATERRSVKELLMAVLPATHQPKLTHTAR